MADRPLSDIEVHDLLHEAVLLLSGKVVRSENGRQVLGAALRDLDILQKALLIMTEGSDPLSFQTAREP